MPEQFTFDNREPVDVDRFEIDRRTYLYCGQPAKNPGDYVYTIAVYVSKDVYDKADGQRQGDWRTQVQTGVLSDKSQIGLPRGSLVPLLWNAAMSRFDLITNHLTNDELMVDPSVTGSDVLDAIARHKGGKD